MQPHKIWSYLAEHTIHSFGVAAVVHEPHVDERLKARLLELNDWKRVCDDITRFHGSAYPSTVYVARNDRDSQDNRILLWVLYDTHLSPEILHNARTVWMTPSDTEGYFCSRIKCCEFHPSDKTWRKVCEAYFSEPMGKGALLDSVHYRSEHLWRIVPGSVGEALWQIACNPHES